MVHCVMPDGVTGRGCTCQTEQTDRAIAARAGAGDTATLTGVQLQNSGQLPTYSLSLGIVRRRHFRRRDSAILCRLAHAPSFPE